MRPSQGLLAALILSLAVGAQGSVSTAASVPASADAQESAAVLRQRGDLVSQRRHVWGVFSSLVTGETPSFEVWRGERELYASTDEEEGARGMRGFGRPPAPAKAAQAVGAPVVTYTLYNDAAFAHIRGNDLQRTAALDGLRRGGEAAVPAFPVESAVIKTAWWPVAGEGVTAMPVWDPESNPPERRGNPYLGWRRIVAVDPSSTPTRATAYVGFMGRTFPEAARIPLTDFHHVRVDAGMARRLAQDAESRRAAIIALGRPIRAGDYLALVGMNLMTHEQDDWVWAAFWWHDRPGAGPSAQGRPPAIGGPWRNYLMQAAFDTETPRSADGAPHVCFNPWLEGRFPDAGNGGGTQSNCMACHQRASYPAAPFLPVTRGAPDRDNDAAFAQDRVRTSFLWSIPIHSRSD